MKELNLEQYLRGNKPQIQNDPAFILETMRRIDSVEVVKKEVDYQKSSGRMAVFVTLVLGLIVGVIVVIALSMFPLESILIYLEPWKNIFFLVFSCMDIVIIVLALCVKRALK